MNMQRKNTVEPTPVKSSFFQLVVFRLGQEEYGLRIDQIKEVVITPKITALPQTPGFIKGVANIRGNIIAILDLEEKFNITRRGDQETSLQNNYTLVIESEDYKMGVLVKEVPNTLTASEADVEHTLITGEVTGEQGYIRGVVKLEKRLIILIDIFKVLSENELGQTMKKAAVSAA